MRTSQSKISSDGIRFSISLKNKKSRESYSHGREPSKVFVILFLWCCYCYLYCCFILQYVYHIMLSASYLTLPWFIARFTLMDSHLYYTFSLIHCRVISSAICNFFPLPCCCSCCCSCSCCWSCCCFCCITCATESIERFYFQMFFYLHPCTASATYLIFAFLKISLDVSSSASKFAENPY